MLSAVSAQNMTGNYSAGLLAGLNSTNLTTLSTVLSGFPDLIAALQMGNYTVRKFPFSMKKEETTMKQKERTRLDAWLFL